MFDKTHIITYVMNIIFYIILSILLFLWLLSVICRRRRVFLSARNQQAVGPTIVAFPTIHELPPGLETTIIDTFPKFPYSRSEHEAGKKMTGECAVCLGAFEEKEALRMLPKCGHVFHAECVDIWLRMHATCPFCRAILLPDGPQSGEGPTQVEVVVINEVGPPQVEVVINVNNTNGRER